MNRILLSGLLALLVWPLFAQPASYQVGTIPDSLLLQADAVIRREDTQADLQALDRMVIRYHRVVTVLKPAGNRHTQAWVGYDNSRKVKDLRASVYDANGREVNSFKRKEFRDVSAVDGGTLYSDSRMLYLDYTPVSYPYTFEINYELELANTSFLPKMTVPDGFRVSCERSRLEVRFAAESLRPEHLEKNTQGFRIARDSSQTHYAFTATSIPALQEESLAPAISELAPQIWFRPRQFSYEGVAGLGNSWQELGLWMQTELLRGRQELPEATRQMALSLVKGVDDPLEKARIIYRYVQDHTRYISVQIGIGGFRPISAVEVDRVKYGDCKGLSNYTRALLEVVGVPSYYVHVQAGRAKTDFEPAFPDLAQGNHAIVAIPQGDDLYWIDCTSQTLPFGFVGDFTDDRLAHVMTPDGGRLVRTPAYRNTDNGQHTEASCRIGADGTLVAEVQMRTTGIQYDAHYRLERMTEKDRIDYYRENWGHLANLQLTSMAFENNRDSVAFTERLHLQAANVVRLAGDRLLVPVNVLNRLLFVPDRESARKLPFEVSRGFEDRERYEIALPEGYQPEALPSPAELESEFGRYRMAVRYLPGEHRLSYEREVLIKEGRYPAGQYEAYRDFRRQIAKWESSQAVLVKSQK